MASDVRFLLCGLAAALALGGCEKKAPPILEEPTASPASSAAAGASASSAAPATPGPASSGATSAALDAFFASADAPLSPDIEEGLFAGLASCGMKEEEVDPECAGYKAWRRAEGRHSRSDNDGSKRVAIKYIDAPSPASRCVAASILGEVWGANTTSRLIDAANKEQVPSVLACMVRRGHVSWVTYPTPAVTGFLVKMADHPSELVRTTVMGRLLFRHGIADHFPDGFLKVAERLDNDPSMAVRKYVCASLYDTEDDRAPPLFAKYLDAKDTPDELYAACFEGVVSAWSRNPRREKPSRQAFDLTMKILEAKPRTSTRPPGDGLGMIGLASASAAPDDREGQQWLKKVAGWYSQGRLRTVLEDIALDAKANPDARSSAVYDLKDLGAPRTTFARMARACEKQGDDCKATTAYAFMTDRAQAK